jgi:hypothetical protein
MTLGKVGRASAAAASTALNSRWIILLTANSFTSRGIYYLSVSIGKGVQSLFATCNLFSTSVNGLK